MVASPPLFRQPRYRGTSGPPHVRCLRSATCLIVLALAGAAVVSGVAPWALSGPDLGEAIVIGLIATPLAPVAKDLSSALAAAVNAMQAVKKK